MIVQIYEIQTPAEAEKCIEAGVDHIGSVILSEQDWKQPLIKETVRVSDGTKARNSIIPLFNDMEILSKVMDYYRPDFIHFCETLTTPLDRQDTQTTGYPFGHLLIHSYT